MMIMIHVFQHFKLFRKFESIKNMYNDYSHKEEVRATRIGLPPQGLRWKKNLKKKRQVKVQKNYASLFIVKQVDHFHHLKNLGVLAYFSHLSDVLRKTHYITVPHHIYYTLDSGSPSVRDDLDRGSLSRRYLVETLI